MTTAVSNMETAYTYAAGRATPDFTDLGAGNIGGLTLVPGLYKWGTGVTVPTNVTLSGSSSGVWIFQIAGTLIVSSGVHVNLSGGALASNIFWQVAGQTTLGTTSLMNGNILDQTAIVLNTGATLNGRALAQTAVTLDGNAVVKPAIIVPLPPTVIATVPGSGASGVALNGAISANFSTAMNSGTILASGTFTLLQGATPIGGTVSYAGITATFQPTANLAPGTPYTATISTAAQDMAGNPLAAPYTWSFTTGATLDVTPPTVISTIPGNTASGVAPNILIRAVFNEAMKATTITSSTFTVMQGVTPVIGTVTCVGATATFTPALPLASSKTYTATITTGATDLANNALAANYVWTFTTQGPVSVGGNAYPINTAFILIPALILALIIAFGASAFLLKRRASR